ncbi:MAG: hypothetical protein IPL61_28910 [Myxococcales bacterium]|nr:hypothetical protein [Myxococcales bacterium]
MSLRAAALAAVLVTACGGREPDDCAVYARREFECGSYPARERAITLKLSEGFCREIKRGNPELQGLPGVKAGPGCATSTTTCAAFLDCIAQAEEPPPPP